MGFASTTGEMDMGIATSKGERTGVSSSGDGVRRHGRALRRRAGDPPV